MKVRRWVTRRGLPHSCGWHPSAPACLAPQDSGPRRGRVPRQPPPLPGLHPRAEPERSLPLHSAVCKALPPVFGGKPACALGPARLPFRGWLHYPLFLLAHLQLPVSTVSIKHTQISLTFGGKTRSTPVTALLAFPPPPPYLSPPPHGYDLCSLAVRARAAMPWPPASPPTHSSEHGDPFPPLPLENCSCLRSQ